MFRQSSIPPRNEFGGNLDCKELVAGSTLYLPVHVAGAMFVVGDGHARQGDGGQIEGVVAALDADERGQLGVAQPAPLLQEAEAVGEGGALGRDRLDAPHLGAVLVQHEFDERRDAVRPLQLVQVRLPRAAARAEAEHLAAGVDRVPRLQRLLSEVDVLDGLLARRGPALGRAARATGRAEARSEARAGWRRVPAGL